MYNKYFTMKRSELKEAIKNEITSVLLEGMSDEKIEQHIQHLMRTGAKEKPLRKLAAIGKKEDEKEKLKEVYQTNSKMSQIVSLFQDMMDDEYDGVDYREVLNMVLKAIDDDYKAAEREGDKFSRIREEEKEEDDDAKDKKAYKGAAKVGKKKSARDKAIDAYNEIGGSKEVKAKAKGAKEGDKEALNWLLSNQKVIKAYNDIPK